MKKIYSLSIALMLGSGIVFGQEIRPVPGTIAPGVISHFNYSNPSPDRAGAYDTTGLVNVSDFLPEFGSVSGNYMWWCFGDCAKGWGGYCFGNNSNEWNIWAQGYANLNSLPVKVIGVIAGFRIKEHDDPSASANSAINFYLFSMAANQAYNTDGSGTYNTTTPNSTGPTGSPLATASLLFSAIDTAVNTTKGNIFPRSNYIPFATQPTFTGDFAIAMDARPTTRPAIGYLPAGTLAPGDTVALCTDVNGDASNLDYAYTLQGYGTVSPKWIVSDQWGSDAASPTLGTGQFDLNMALFAVFSDATGVNEFYNGMKLTTYPNPSVDKATIEYTLEKNANKVRLSVFDANGGKIIDNELGSQASGTYKIDIDTKEVAAGTYFYQLRANGRTFTKQLIVTK